MCSEVIPSIRKTGSFNVGIQDQIALEKHRMETIRFAQEVLEDDPQARMMIKERTMDLLRPNTVLLANGNAALPSDISTLMDGMGYTSQQVKDYRGKVGTKIKKEFEKRFDCTPLKIEKYVNGAYRPVNVYEPRHHDTIKKIIQHFMQGEGQYPSK